MSNTQRPEYFASLAVDITLERMRNIVILIALCGIFCLPVLAQKVPSVVTSTQIEEYQVKGEAQCVAAGRADGRRPPAAARSYCKCVFDALKESMTFNEWKEAYQLSFVDREAEWGIFDGRTDRIAPRCARRTL